MARPPPRADQGRYGGGFAGFGHRRPGLVTEVFRVRLHLSRLRVRLEVKLITTEENSTIATLD